MNRAPRREPRRPPGLRGDEVSRLYRHRFSPDERSRRREIWRELCAWFQGRYVHEEDVLLDLGAGLCDFVNQIRCARRFALDLDPEVVRYAAAGVEAIVGDAGSLDALDLPPLSVVFASNVFEHVRTKELLLQTLAAVRRALAPGGRLIIMQPNLRFLGGEYWDFLDHHIPLTHVSMTELLSVTGYAVREVRPRFLPYTTKSALPQHPLLVRAYLRFRPAHRLLGRQMLLVAERPEAGGPGS